MSDAIKIVSFAARDASPAAIPLSWPARQGAMGPIGTTKFALAGGRLALACLLLICGLLVGTALWFLVPRVGLLPGGLVALFMGLVTLSLPTLFHNLDYLETRRKTWVAGQRILLRMCLIGVYIALVIAFWPVAFSEPSPQPAFDKRQEASLRADLKAYQRERDVWGHRCFYTSWHNACPRWASGAWSAFQIERQLFVYPPQDDTSHALRVAVFIALCALGGLALFLATFSLPGASEGYHEQMRQNAAAGAPVLAEEASLPSIVPPQKAAASEDPVFDALQAWWKECVVMKSGNKIAIARLYPHYVSFCDQSGAKAYENANAFSQKLSPILGKHDVFRDGSDVRTLVGIDLSTNGLSGKILDGMRTDA